MMCCCRKRVPGHTLERQLLLCPLPRASRPLPSEQLGPAICSGCEVQALLRSSTSHGLKFLKSSTRMFPPSNCLFQVRFTMTKRFISTIRNIKLVVFTCLFVCLFIVLIQSLKLMVIFLPQPPEYWDFRLVSILLRQANSI